MEKCTIEHIGNWKILTSENYNCRFNMENGYTEVWGKTKEDNPDYCPYGPEIFDIEITTKCAGIDNKPCAWCYKSNTSKGTNMSFETFKRVFDQLPKTVNQIAFGADAQCKSNPDIWKMMDYCIEHNVIPNITVADIDYDTAKKLVARCGAVAVSFYGDGAYDYGGPFRKSLHNLQMALKENLVAVKHKTNKIGKFRKSVYRG